MRYRTTIAGQGFAFDDLRQVMAAASPAPDQRQPLLRAVGQLQ